LLFPKILGIRGLDALSVLGASDEINQVMEAVGEGHWTNRKKTRNIDCDYNSTTGTEP
jgi:hypothetical protein